MEVRLLELMQEQLGVSDGWGHEMGRKIHDKLREVVEKQTTETIITISLKGVKRADASFLRESTLSLAKLYREKKGFCLSDIENEDLVENIEVAAGKFEQPITYWPNSNGRILGPQPSEGLKEMLIYALKVPVVYTNEAARELDLKVPNASNKLNQLWKAGYILRRERVATSGGLEHEYFRIK